jgi:hypothetical protein
MYDDYDDNDDSDDCGGDDDDDDDEDDKDRSGSGREIGRKIVKETRSWLTLTRMGRIVNIKLWDDDGGGGGEHSKSDRDFALFFVSFSETPERRSLPCLAFTASWIACVFGLVWVVVFLCCVVARWCGCACGVSGVGCCCVCALHCVVVSSRVESSCLGWV